MDLVGQGLGIGNAFRHNDDEVLFAGNLGLAHTLENVTLKVERTLRQQHSQSTGSNADVQRNIACMVAHNLNNTAAVMALGGITQFINGLYRGIHGCIIANGILAAGNIVINGAGNANAGNALVRQCAGAHERTVAADDHEGINAKFLTACKAFGLAFLGFELQAAGSIQNRTAAVDDLRHAADVHLVAFAVDQAVITALNAHHAVALGDACADNGAYRCIHAGGVAAAGQYTDGFDFLSHKNVLLL